MQRLTNRRWAFVAFRKHVGAHGLYSVGSRVIGRLLSAARTLRHYDEPVWNIQLTNGTMAFLANSDLLWSNLDDDDPRLQQVASEYAQACFGLEMPFVMINRQQDGTVLLSQKFLYSCPILKIK